MRRLLSVMLLLVMLLPLLCGCDALFGDGNPPSTPQNENTPSPTPTVEPTATPNIPPVQDGLLSMEEIVDLPTADWPQAAVIRYRHTNGMVYAAQGKLFRGDGFLLYALANTASAGAEDFTLSQEAEGEWRLGAVRTEENPYNSLEGIFIFPSGEQGEMALADAMGRWQEEGFLLVQQDSLAAWNQRIDSTSMLYGALPYDGEYRHMQFGNAMLHIFTIQREGGAVTAVMRIEQVGSVTQLEYFLCAMLSTLRVTG